MSTPSIEGPDRSRRVSGLWDEHRRCAFDVSYRLLGSVSEAEDVVQDAYARLLMADLDRIDDVRGWLITVSSRLCIDRLRRHDHRRTSYVGPWLPEPVVAGAGPVPVEDRITLDDSVRMALLVVLEQLSPAERTAFVLHDVFALPYDQIGGIVGRSPQACRQLASRARRRIDADPATARFAVPGPDHAELVERFAEACSRGDLEALIEVLASDVVGDFDSGGTIPGAPVTELDGAEAVARQLVASMPAAGASYRAASVNGDRGLIVSVGGVVGAVIAFGFRRGRIDRIYGIGNPAKLDHIQPLGRVRRGPAQASRTSSDQAP
jgi:RNA polymerase sigma-70 factor (ECF subfamily)